MHHGRPKRRREKGAERLFEQIMAEHPKFEEIHKFANQRSSVNSKEDKQNQTHIERHYK